MLLIFFLFLHGVLFMAHSVKSTSILIIYTYLLLIYQPPHPPLPQQHYHQQRPMHPATKQTMQQQPRKFSRHHQRELFHSGQTLSIQRAQLGSDSFSCACFHSLLWFWCGVKMTTVGNMPVLVRKEIVVSGSCLMIGPLIREDN